MKFVHIADMHFDSPFVNLSDKGILGDLRRLEQRKVFKKIIEYIKDNNIEYFFISGDLYENKYVKLSTIEYINNLFKEIPSTKIFISPGNHDPYIKNSYYNKFKWNENVKIFNAKIEKIEMDDVNIYGYGFDDFYCINCGIEDLQIENKNKLNILVIHGTLDGAEIEEKQYNSINTAMLQKKGFDYIALGHIHKLNYNREENQRIIYPGSTISLGFDELGKHGMIVGNLEKNGIELDFIPLDEEEFKEKELDITNIISKEELIEKMNTIKVEKNEYLKIILVGYRNFEISKYDRIIKIKDNTKMSYDLNKLSNENTLKGLYAKEMLKRLSKGDIQEEEKKILEKAVEIGLETLE